MSEEKRSVGRPRKYDSPEEFDAKVDEYWQACRENGEPITWTGLALYLGFAGRTCIDEYAKYDGFSHSVKRAKSMVEMAYERRLHENGSTGAIFALKNMGWSDKQELSHTSPDGSMSPPSRIEIVAAEHDNSAD